MHECVLQIGGNYAYNLYDECGPENVLSSSAPTTWREATGRQYFSSAPAVRTSGLADTGALNDYPCGGVGAMLKWLNTSSVMEALHVPKVVWYGMVWPE